MDGRFHTIAAEGIEVTLDLRVGHIRTLAVRHGSRVLTPLHTAPWVDDAAITGDETLPAHLRFLSGDFFCAPFGAGDVEDTPAHGWPANSLWHHLETRQEPGGLTAVYRLERSVMGATVEKRFTLRDGHPFLYQTHVFAGGAGAIPVANHAMIRLPAGGRLAFSPKWFAETPDTPLEGDPATGRSHLAYPARAADPARVPAADGGTADITRYPLADAHEDFLMLVEEPANRLGWVAASRPESRDAMLSLKSPLDYPVTFLWFSNGGRHYSPWNGRHTGVLGIEEGRACSLLGHRGSIAPNALSDAGVPTALALRRDGEVSVRNVIGAMPLGPDGAPITEVIERPGRLDVLCEDGGRFAVAFDAGFLDRT